MIRLSLVAFAISLIGGVLFAQAPSKPQGVFMLLLSEDSTFKNLDDKQSQIAEYTNWANDLGKKGLLVDGAKLKDNGMFVGPKVQRKVTPAELPVTGNGIAGYFVVRAENYDAAVKLAMTCPHIKYGGQVVIRQLEVGNSAN